MPFDGPVELQLEGETGFIGRMVMDQAEGLVFRGLRSETFPNPLLKEFALKSY